MRTLLSESWTCRLSATSGDEGEACLASADHRGWAAARDRVNSILCGFRADLLAQSFDVATAATFDVAASFLAALDPERLLDGYLRMLDAAPGAVRLADGTKGLGPVPGGERVVVPTDSLAWSARIAPVEAALAMTRGQTVIANEVGPRVGGALLEFVNCLSRVSGVRAQVNTYVSEREAPGFGLHWDDHDVLIIQLIGAKHWEILQPVALSPLVPWVSKEAFGESVFSTVLRPGEGLFIPRGWGHRVHGFEGSTSAHYTVGLRRPTLIDLLPRLCESVEVSPAEMDQLGPSVDRAALEHVIGEIRGRLMAAPSQGPLFAARALAANLDGVLLHAPLPGGLVFVDSPELADDEIGILAGRNAYAFGRHEVALVARLLENEPVSMSDLITGAGSGERASLERSVMALARDDVVNLVAQDGS